jgi:hypothetical protein
MPFLFPGDGRPTPADGPNTFPIAKPEKRFAPDAPLKIPTLPPRACANGTAPHDFTTEDRAIYDTGPRPKTDKQFYLAGLTLC